MFSPNAEGNRAKLQISGTHRMLAKLRIKKEKLQRLRQTTEQDLSSRVSNESLRYQLPTMSIFESEHVACRLECWNYKEHLQKENIFDLLWSNIQEHLRPDLVIQIGNVNFKCYHLILQCYTSSLVGKKHHHGHIDLNELPMMPTAMATPPMTTTRTSRTIITATSFMKLYNWMLNDDVVMRQADVLHLFCAAETLKVEELKNQCWMLLDDSSVYCENLAYDLCKEAARYEMTSIRQLMMPRVCKFFLTLVASEDFLQMPTDEVCQWLSSNAIGVNSEMEIFYAAVLWLNSKWSERKGRALRKVMSCVRFGLMPPWFLVALHTTTNSADVGRVIKDSKVKKFIADGLSLTTTILFYSKKSDEFEEFLRRSKLKIPMSRKWIFDRSCSYHFHKDIQMMPRISYETFVEYLESLRKLGPDYWRTLEMASERHWSFMCSLKPNVDGLSDGV